MQNRTERLFRRYREKGDARALGAVFDRTAPELLRVALHLTRDPHRAEDLLQSTFLAAMEGARHYDERRPLLPWLLGILANRARTWRRGERRPAEIPPDLVDEGSDDVPDRIGERELAEVCSRALDGLSEPYRHVLILHLRHGLSGAEIAAALDRPASTVRNQIARGMNMLRRALPAIGASVAALAVGAGRGLAAVREAILAEVPVAVATGAAISSIPVMGAWMMSKTTTLCLATALAALVGWSLHEPGGHEPAAPGREVVHEEPLEVEAPRTSPPSSPSPPGSQVAGKARRSVVATAPAMGDLQVTVVYKGEDAPAHDVPYELWQWEGERRGPTQRAGRTDSDGAALIDDVPPGDYILDLVLGTEPEKTWFRVAAGEVVERKLTIARGWILDGIVVDGDGRAIEGAEVRKEDSGGRPIILARTAADGTFAIPHLRANIKLWALAPGRQPSHHQHVEKRREGAHVRLVVGAPGALLNGRVEDEAGRPAPRALVSIGVPQDLGSHFVQRELYALTAGEDGSFAVDWLPPGRIFIGALPADGDRARATAHWVDVARDGPVQARLRLGDGGRLVGRVLDANGSAVAGASLHASHMGESGLGAFDWAIVETDEEGRYTLAGLAPGRHRVWATRGAIRAETEVEVQRAREQRWDVRLVAGTGLTVLLLDPDGAPLPERRIELQSEDPTQGWRRAASARTEADGRCVFENLQPVAHRLCGLTNELRALAFQRDDVVPDGGELVVRLVAEELPTAVIGGRVVDARARPVPDARLSLQQEGWPYVMSLPLDGEGRFSTGLLVPGAYSLSARAPGAGMAYATTAVPRLAAQEEHDVGDLVLEDPARVEVSLQAADGGEVTEPILQLVPQGMTSPGGFELEWDGVDRVYRSSELNPGNYTLAFFAANALAETQMLELAGGKTRRIDLSVRRGHPIVLELRFAAQNPAESGLLNGALTVTDGDGREIVSRRLFGYYDDFEQRLERVRMALASGTYRVVASDYWTKKEVEVGLVVPIDASAADAVELDLR